MPGVAIASPFRSDVLRGKRCLVTGGTSGIGFEIARQLGLHGAKNSLGSHSNAPSGFQTKTARERAHGPT